MVFKVETDDNVRVLLKENSKPVGAIQSISSEKENVYHITRAVFDRYKTSSEDIRNIKFEIEVENDGVATYLGAFSFKGKPLMWLTEDFAIISNALIEKI